jgi:hypothetical protein
MGYADKGSEKMSDTIEISIPLINKHHCCNDCTKKKGKMCLQWDKPTCDIALECEPKPEWEKTKYKL